MSAFLAEARASTKSACLQAPKEAPRLYRITWINSLHHDGLRAEDHHVQILCPQEANELLHHLHLCGLKPEAVEAIR